jgi:cytosine permease
MSKIAASGETGRLAELIEDHALERVPADRRKSGWALAWSTTGIVTTLIQLLIGSYVAAVVGFGGAVAAGVLVAIFGATMGWLVGHIAHHEGLSSTISARLYGLGIRGSAIASAIYGFMILGFLALENALLYNGTLFAFGWHDTSFHRILIYGILTIAWILLTAFGINLVTRVASVLVIAMLALLAFMVWRAGFDSGIPIWQTLSHGPLIPGLGSAWDRFQIALVTLAASAGALALTDADYARFARTTRDVGILAVAGAVAIDILVVVTGAVIVYGATPIVAHYLIVHHQATAANAPQQATALGNANTGAFFIVLSSVAGFLLMYAAQGKCQVLNTYSGSLALSNLFDVLLRWRPGRLAMVILGNLIGLAMIALSILDKVLAWLGILSIITTGFAALMVADYYLVRPRIEMEHAEVDAVNWAGVITIVVASVVSYVLQDRHIFRLGFLLALVITLILYPLLRVTILRPGTLTSRKPALTVGSQAAS